MFIYTSDITHLSRWLLLKYSFCSTVWWQLCNNWADLNTRDHVLMKAVLIVNLEVKDNHEEAAIGARLTFDLCQEVQLSWISFHYSFVWICYDFFFFFLFYDRLNGLNRGKIRLMILWLPSRNIKEESCCIAFPFTEDTMILLEYWICAAATVSILVILFGFSCSSSFQETRNQKLK